jgi:hypothetical protein
MLIATFGIGMQIGYAQTACAQQATPTPRALLDRYCVTCHSQKAKAAGLEAAQRLTLDQVDPSHVEKNPQMWETVVCKLRSGERFTRSDFNTLRYQVTVDDPRTYTRPWTGGWTIRWVPDEDIQEYFCEENAESTFVR